MRALQASWARRAASSAARASWPWLAHEHGPPDGAVVALVSRGHRQHHQVVALDLAERGPREDRPGVRSRRHDGVDPRPLGARPAHRRLGLRRDGALGGARVDRGHGCVDPGLGESVGVADHGDLGSRLAGSEAADRVLDIDPFRVGQRRPQGSRRGDVQEAHAGNAEPANRARGADQPGDHVGQGLDATERVVLVRVRELAKNPHVRNPAHAQRVLVALGPAYDHGIARERHDDGHRLEVDRDVGQPADVRRAEHGAVVAVGDEQVEPFGLHQRLDAPPPTRVFLGRDGRSGDVHAGLPWCGRCRRRS